MRILISLDLPQSLEKESRKISIPVGVFFPETHKRHFRAQYWQPKVRLQSVLNLQKQHRLSGFSLLDKNGGKLEWNKRFEEQTNLLKLARISDHTGFCYNNSHENIPSLVKPRTLTKLSSTRAGNKKDSFKNGCHLETCKKSQGSNVRKFVDSQRPNDLFEERKQSTRKYHCSQRTKPLKETTLSEGSQKGYHSDLEVKALTFCDSLNGKARHQNDQKIKGKTYYVAHSGNTSIHDDHEVKAGKRRRQNDHNVAAVMFPVSCNGNKSKYNDHEVKTGENRHHPNDHKVKRVTPHVPHSSKTSSHNNHKVEAGKPRPQDDHKTKAEMFPVSCNGNISNHDDHGVKSVTFPVSWNGTKKHQSVKRSNRNDHEVKVGTKRYHKDHQVKTEMPPLTRSSKTSNPNDHEVKAGKRRRQNNKSEVNAEMVPVSCSGNTSNYNDHKVKSVTFPVSWSGKSSYQNLYNPETSLVPRSGKTSNHNYHEVKAWTFPVFLSGKTSYQNVYKVKTYPSMVPRSGETSNHNYPEVKAWRFPVYWSGNNSYQNNHSVKTETIHVSWSDENRNKKGIVTKPRKLEPLSKAQQNSIYSEEEPNTLYENKRNRVQSCRCVYKINPVEYEKHVENLKHELLAYSETCYYGPIAEELIDVNIINAVNKRTKK